MALSDEQKKQISQKLGEVINEESADDLKAAGNFIWCRPCPYYPASGCWTFIGDCK